MVVGSVMSVGGVGQVRARAGVSRAPGPVAGVALRSSFAPAGCSSGSASCFLGGGGLPGLGAGLELGEARVVASSHGKKIHRLGGRPADQRKALLRGLTTDLLRNGQVKTTLARAKAMRKPADKMIGLAKRGGLHARRQALGYIYDPNLVTALFNGVPDRYGDRDGGYTRITHLMPRRGDNAPMALIELV